MPHIAEQQGSAAVLEQLRNLICMKRRVQRNRRTTGRDDAKVRSNPARMIVSQNRNSCAGLKPALREPAANALRHSPRFVVSLAFHAVTALNFQRNVVRPARCALAEELVEGRHGPAEKYT